jgi:acyl-[acyl-carrier-protein]-phospholipid O-acyltransferase/long-chain-fatty-acid--[acyl-carrier-protein] ligase
MPETLGSRFLRTAKARWSALCVADSTGRELTFGRTLVGALLLQDIITRIAPRDVNLGLLLPASVGGALANIATTFAGKVPVNLNFTAGHDAMAAAIERCGITTILTSRAFVKKAGIETLHGMVYLEDLLGRTSRFARLRMLVAAKWSSAEALERRLAAPAQGAESLATIIFSSGSTGEPKGVMLTHYNIASNAEQLGQMFSSGSTGVPKGVMLTHANVLANIDGANALFQLAPNDVMLGILPFFHSFGFTATLWLPLAIGAAAAYHPNPTDAKTIGDLAAKYGATILVSTPTFCAAYVRKIVPAQFARLRLAIVGAERLRAPVACAFKEKFGVELTEGYGCTEMAPVVAVNVPDAAGATTRPGSVGRPLPGVRAMIVDLDTGEGPLVDREGLLLVDGPNKMAGYLDDPDQTRAAMRGDWYVTGDIATIDRDGFIRITDRLSRFSKIAGEMVPHMKIEEALQSLLHEPHVAIVTSVPDATKGERIVAFHTDPDVSAQSVSEGLAASGLPKLWIPKREDIRYAEVIPTLGTGKVDLRAVRGLAALPPDKASQSETW